MPLSLRTTTLSATASHGGIRCYTKTADGDVREACNGTTEAQLSSAISSKDIVSMQQGKEWFPGELRFRAGADSSLCAIAWAAWSQSVFYQAEDGTLREKRHADAWQDTDFAQDNVLLGTNVAAVHSSDGAKVMLFFQDTEGHVCYRRGQSGQWSPQAVRLCKGLKHCGLGAVSWNELENIRMYYQDEEFHIREFRGGFNAEWKVVQGFGFPYKKPIGDINAVGWATDAEHVELRLYLQNDENNVVEWCNSGQGWYNGNLEEAALPEADIAAYIRKVDSSYSVAVMWTGQDQVLYQKVCIDGEWLEKTPIASFQTAGRNVGYWVGKQFSDNVPDIDTKYIQKIRFSTGVVVDGLAIDYTDGTSTEWHGSQGGHASEFELSNGEDITQIQVCFDNQVIRGLQFTTSDGRASHWYGSEGDNKQLWEQQGHALAGFIGAAEQFVHGLMPIWSIRLSEANPSSLTDCISRAKRIGAEIDASATQIREAEAQLAQYKGAAEARLKEPAEAVMQSVAALVGNIEWLHEEMGDLQRARIASSRADREKRIAELVATCKRQAMEVSGALKVLAEAADELAANGGQAALLGRLARESRAAADRQKALRVIEKVARGFEANAQVSKQTLEAEEASATARLDKLRELRDAAEAHENSTKTHKVIRDWATLGVGNFFDWGSYNKHLQSDRQLVANAESDLRITRSNAAAARRALAGVTADLSLLQSLFTTLREGLDALHVVQAAAQALADKTAALGNASKDLRGLVRQMYDSSEELDAPFTPELFAAGVLAIGRLADMSPDLKGIMGDRPAAYQEALRAIVGSPETQATVTE